jgi:16S rRNA (uracil1498-N3)-methyltransferase
MIRLAVAEPLASGGLLALSGEQAHYLLNVMRLKPGAEVLAFNGRDGEWAARLEAAGSRLAALRIERRTRAFQSPPDLWLLLALVKRGPLETIVEKAVELGAAQIQLLTSRRTNAERTRVDRLQRIAVEAAEQTGRLDVPEVRGPDRLDDVLDAWDPARGLMFCDESGDDPSAEWGGPRGRARPALEALSAGAGAAPWAILIGPEGGFDPAERAKLRSLPFVTPVTLGPRILRADTAAIAALTLWQAALGDWRQG